MINNKIFLFVIFSFITCTEKNTIYNHTVKEVDLGNNFYYLADGRESQILFNLRPGAKSKFGKTIIPPEVVRYNYDSKYIIAQTTENSNGNKLNKYWIIKKEQKPLDTIIAFDSITFYKQIHNLKIKLKARE